MFEMDGKLFLGGLEDVLSNVQDNGRPKYTRRHKFILKSGHKISIYWDVILEIYRAQYSSMRSGQHNIGQPTLREIIGQIRSRVSEDINPDIGTIRRRVVKTESYRLASGIAIDPDGNMHSWNQKGE